MDAEPAGLQLASRPGQGGRSQLGDIGSHWCDLAEWVTAEQIGFTGCDYIDSDPAATSRTTETFSAAASDAPLADVTTEDSALILFHTANDVAGSAVISSSPLDGRTGWLR